MRRFAIITVLLLGGALTAVNQSQAQTSPPVTLINGFCFVGSAITLTPCPVAPAPTLGPPSITKLLQVSAGTKAPEGTTSYEVNLVSRAACFALGEPITVYTAGVGGGAVLTPVYPQYAPSQGAPVTVHVDQNPNSPRAGEASLSLEVLDKAVGPDGLNLKAVWPQEGVERVVQIVPPSTPTPTATYVPGQVTNTAVPPAIKATAVTPSATPETPLPTVTATPYPTPRPGSFFVHACVDPLTIPGKSLGGGQGILYGQTVPGATCYPDVVFSDGGRPIDTAYVQEIHQGAVANADGFVAFSFSENSDANFGIASVTCSFGSQSQTGFGYFYISQDNPPGPQPGGICPPGPDSGVRAAANVTQLTPPQGSIETVVGCLSVDGVGIPNLPMLAIYHFANHTSLCSGQTNASGVASCSVDIGRAQPNYPVVVEVYFRYGGHTYVAVTEFTPVCLGSSCTSVPASGP